MRKCNNKGFTLVELIVVIGILVVLAAILIPVVSGYLNDSKESACYADKNTIIRAYKSQYALLRAHGEDTAVEKVLEACKSTFPGAAVNGKTVTGVCPSGGKYTISSTAEGEVTIVCDKHAAGHVYTPKEIGASFVETVTSISTELSNKNAYSTVPNEDRAKLLAALPKGVADSMAGKTWTYNKTDKKMYIYDGDISELSTDTKITITVYNINTGTVSTDYGYHIGTASSGSNKYKVLR